MVKLKVTVADFLVMAVIAVAAVLLLIVPLLRTDDGLVLRVTTGEGEVYTYTLDRDREFVIDGAGYTLTVRIEQGKAFVTHSDCPDKICQKSGTISRQGEIIICAPAQISIVIEGGEDDVDFVAG